MELKKSTDAGNQTKVQAGNFYPSVRAVGEQSSHQLPAQKADILILAGKH